ncbi:hypothetical protein [Cellulosimicrobium sp. CUA-896]|uniref:hypothetical protein n=1 Tax=Cellulosimicrobium sp. CUA-896 TaxID=1517881 RepID=UPI0009F914BF|nr:hypothetical protein [Cellulosimicrobium sp. CUA-896]
MPDAVAARPAPPRPTTLRRRLVVVLVGVLLLVTAALATTSALALRGQLVDELDQSLVEAGRREERPPGLDRPPDGAPGADSGADPLAGAAPAGDDPARFPFGVGPGTVVVRYDDDTLALAGYVTTAGTFTQLDDEQVEAFAAVPVDGRRTTSTRPASAATAPSPRRATTGP